MTLAFLNIGTQEMILIVIVVLLLFGGKKLPELARGLGRGIREFKDASEDIKREISDQINNFEKEIKDIDVIVEDKPKSDMVVENKLDDSSENNTTQDTEQVATEKKVPQFTTPENTYQHNPGGHPADDTEYYKYGYNDHFATDETEENNSETTKEDLPTADSEKKA